MYRALYDFKSNGPGVLSFQKDEVFQVSEKIDDHWLMGKNTTGDTGLLPVAYLEQQDNQVKLKVILTAQLYFSVNTEVAFRKGTLFCSIRL